MGLITKKVWFKRYLKGFGNITKIKTLKLLFSKHFVAWYLNDFSLWWSWMICYLIKEVVHSCCKEVSLSKISKILSKISVVDSCSLAVFQLTPKATSRRVFPANFSKVLITVKPYISCKQLLLLNWKLLWRHI